MDKDRLYRDYEVMFKCKIVKKRPRHSLYSVWQGRIFQFKHKRHLDKFNAYIQLILDGCIAWREHIERQKMKENERLSALPKSD